jgi:integrase
MGRRRRIKTEHELPPRVYLHYGAYRYVPRFGNKVSLGRDYAEAMRKWALLKQPVSPAGTVAALIDWYLVNVAKKKATRTYDDNLKEAVYLKAGLGHIPIKGLRPKHVAKYLEQRDDDGAAVRGNREKALLSHCFTKAMVEGWADANPCRGVHRNRERPRERMIEDAEAAAVFAVAVTSVRRMMTLIYASCQRPEDCLRFGPANIKRIEKEGREIRVLRVRQAKTGKSLDIEVTGELEKLINECLAEAVVHQTFVHREDGKRYTYAGLSCMFRRYVKKCGLKDFGLYDLKGKAATDMYRAGVPLEQIQHLLGHSSIKTTEIYIKARLPDLVAPTSRPMVRQQAGDGK